MEKSEETPKEFNPFLLETGTHIALERNARSMTQAELADKADGGLNGNAVSRIENGRTDLRVTTFFSITEALCVTPNDLCPARLLAGTPLERYGGLNQKGREAVRGIIDILLTEHTGFSD